MKIKTMTTQRGQATTEFVAAMALFIPLIMGVIYVGKYSDIKHQAIQASRYAAMERALDPNRQESDTIVRNETVARFFRDGALHPIGKDDDAQVATAGDENPNWSMVTGDPMISQYSDVSVTLSRKSPDSALLAPVDLATHAFNELHAFNDSNNGIGIEADVEVPVANIAHFGPLSNINLKIGATTVMAGDPWNADGTQDVANHFTPLSVPARAVQLLTKFPGLDQFFSLLVDTPPPQFGCVKPDVVPPSAVPAGHYDPTDDPIHPSNIDDKCY